jgi:cell division septation protein DedD
MELFCTGNKRKQSAALLIFLFAGYGVANAAPPPPLPEGDNGIASRYPRDANIHYDPAVVFNDDFESYTTASQLTTNWSTYFQASHTRIATETGNVHTGTKALEFTLPQSTVEVANAVGKNISPAEDVLFARVYTKFDPTYNVPGSNHNGIRLSAKFPEGQPGLVPSGTNFFLVLLQNNMMPTDAPAPGYSELYVYHPEQRSQWGDIFLPTGMVLPNGWIPGNFGQYFVPRPNFVPLRDRWYCYELMVKANTPGQRDGRAAFWIDGKLIADFQNLRMRDINTLKIDRVQLTLHAGTCPRLTKKWYDNLVVAKSYIGPLVGATPTPTATPTPSPTATPAPTSTPTPPPPPTPTPSPAATPTLSPSATPESTPSSTPTPTAMPTIRVSVSPTQIVEGSDATFTISSSIILSQPITVTYSMRGTAVEGSDYSLGGISGQVTIPAGQSSATVGLHPIADQVKERNETATMRLTNGIGYRLPKRPKASLTILNGP